MPPRLTAVGLCRFESAAAAYLSQRSYTGLDMGAAAPEGGIVEGLSGIASGYAHDRARTHPKP